MAAGIDWVALGGIAQFVAAGATIALAAVTAYMAIKTRAVAEETKKESSATQSLAAEARRDRELAWRPQVSLLEFNVQAPDQPLFTSTFKVRNAGGGPALDCRIAAHLPDNLNFWWLASVGDMAQGAETSGRGEMRPDAGMPYEIFDYETDVKPVVPDVMIFCTDVIGRRFRFPIAGAFDSVHSKPYMLPDVYVVGDPDPPRWASSPLLWP